MPPTAEVRTHCCSSFPLSHGILICARTQTRAVTQAKSIVYSFFFTKLLDAPAQPTQSRPFRATLHDSEQLRLTASMQTPQRGWLAVGKRS